MYKKILVPVSNESNINLIVDFALDFLNPAGEIMLLYVTTSTRLPGSAIEWRKAVNTLSEMYAVSVSMGVNARYHIRNSWSVHAGILEEAATGDYDLVFFANSTYKRMPRRLFGSKIDEVVRKSPVETIVLSYLPDKPVGYDRILLPTSGYQHAMKAAKIAEAIAKRQGSEVTVMYVGDPSRKADAESVLSKVTEDMDAENVRNRSLFRSGPVAETIIDEARKGYDLLMIGATERPLAHEFLLGSTADTIVSNTPCHVLMVKTVRRK